ncbi:polyprenyl synthetase family protein [Usitatibacter palustris]|uniref:Farnesyl diphosphate synthase n=1 Tax=Usitatibacter palustris TaxID=2732487 RepID=A0A6M4H9W7_9PROT|nr:Farnesyl diphosphate synthase [Usitatibacter palustris]
MSGPTFDDWARDIAARTEEALGELLPTARVAPGRLHDAMRYSVLGGGKRVRPMLAYAAGLVSDADPQRLRVAAAAVEMIHAYSLIHDDLPCMDDDVLRRGKPTTHVEFDEATALLAGDALQSLAFQLLAEYRLADDPSAQLHMIQVFAVACGSRGMAGGQAIDLENVGKALTLPELEFMHILKTGALIRASVLLGAHCGKVPDSAQMERLDRYAKCVGLAFQVVDDILDDEGDTATLGKTAGKDRDANKPTYTSLLGLPGAKKFADELLADAHEALSTFGEQARRLHELADFIVKRDR